MTMNGSVFRPFKAIVAIGMAAAVVAGLTGPGAAMTVAERAKLDLSQYKVVNTKAGYFDIAERRAELARTSDNLLLRQIADLRALDLCPGSRQLPVISGKVVIPKFYDDRDGWRKGAVPFQAFEDMASKLAAQQFVAPQSGAGLCLIEMLDRWAQAQAFMDIDNKTSGLQTWLTTETSLFAAALAYAVVKEDIADRPIEKRRIERWLVAAANNHLRYAGAKEGSCCNNHFYRRALYAAMIGVVAGDDALFRLGVSAIYSALSDTTPAGALRLEMVRRELSGKYQVYATMHLALIAQVAARQGYDLYQIDRDGRTLGQIVDFALGTMLVPESAADASKTPWQSAEFLGEDQYYAWLELLTGRPKWSGTVQSLLSSHRPAYNRSVGGFMTLYFLPLPPKP